MYVKNKLESRRNGVTTMNNLLESSVRCSRFISNEKDIEKDDSNFLQLLPMNTITRAMVFE